MDKIYSVIVPIIALIALVSPIVTALINNHHIAQMKHLEIQAEQYHQNSAHERELFENYLKSLADSSRGVPNGSLQLMENYYLLLPYVPRKQAQRFGDFTLKMANNRGPLNQNDATALTELILAIKSQLEPK